ncbi:hypothetical protein [Pseudoxanthomonas mexicana]|uniref:hypothetical protein n=1 Tax=Pseudoxanthomonas mexicana TaxID=128785 RepID=UPI0022F3C818|nr:hypothetical protein [Pseudoxanthomonas mexicana]WBX95206.1 hypothetical protein PE064_08505 [Pseudoxanthomonas mexicana]
MANEAGEVARILYKELVEGDLRKLQAQAADSDSGGGARDFRFRSFDTLLPVIKQMFPHAVKETRRRSGQSAQVDIFKGQFSWYDENRNIVTKEAYMEPPTSARPGEGRIARIHEYPCFDASKVKIGVGNRVLLLLIQLHDGSVWPYYAEERSLRTPGDWHPVVARELLDCLDARRPANQAVLGFRDFTNAGRFCNGH